MCPQGLVRPSALTWGGAWHRGQPSYASLSPGQDSKGSFAHLVLTCFWFTSHNLQASVACPRHTGWSLLWPAILLVRTYLQLPCGYMDSGHTDRLRPQHRKLSDRDQVCNLSPLKLSDALVTAQTMLAPEVLTDTLVSREHCPLKSPRPRDVDRCSSIPV